MDQCRYSGIGGFDSGMFERHLKRRASPDTPLAGLGSSGSESTWSSALSVADGFASWTGSRTLVDVAELLEDGW